jgi:hypothetical protein
MKRIILTILLASTICTLSAQTTIPLKPNTTGIPLAVRMDLVTWLSYVPKDYLAGSKVGTLEIKVRNYDVYQTGSGQFYIEFTNSKLTTSRKYLGYTYGLNMKYEGNTIFLSKDTTEAWIWTVDRYGQIYKMDMPDWFATDSKLLLKQLAVPE